MAGLSVRNISADSMLLKLQGINRSSCCLDLMLGEFTGSFLCGKYGGEYIKEDVVMESCRYYHHWAGSFAGKCFIELRIRAEQEKVAKEKAEIEQIIATYETALRDNPNDSKVYGQRGLAFLTKGYYDQAIDDYTQMIRINPNDISAYLSRGGAYSQKKELDKAIDDYTQVIRLNPNDTVAYPLRGMVYARKGKYEQAMADFDKALLIDPKCKDAYLGKGFVYSAKVKHSRSIASYKVALRLDPSDKHIVFLLENAQRVKKGASRRRWERVKKTPIIGLLVQFGLMIAFLCVLWGTKFNGAIMLIIPGLISLVCGLISWLFRRDKLFRGHFPRSVVFLFLMIAITSVTLNVGDDDKGLIGSIISVLFPLAFVIYMLKLGELWNVKEYAKNFIIYFFIGLIAGEIIASFSNNYSMLFFFVMLGTAVPGIIIICKMEEWGYKI